MESTTVIDSNKVLPIHLVKESLDILKRNGHTNQMLTIHADVQGCLRQELR